MKILQPRQISINHSERIASGTQAGSQACLLWAGFGLKAARGVAFETLRASFSLIPALGVTSG